MKELKHKFYVVFNMVLSIFAIISIYFAIADITNQIDMKNIYVLIIDIIIWITFTLDYIVRLFHAENKREFIKHNILDSLAIIPVPILSLFINSQVVGFLRLFRVLAFLDELRDGFKIFMKHRGVAYAVYILIITIVGASLGIYFVENGTTVTSLSDAFWWSIVTTTTVGYGDISPKTGIGRMIAVTLMLTGVCVFGIVMSAVAQILTEKKVSDEDLESEILDLSGLNKQQRIHIKQYLEFLKTQRGED